MLIQYQNGVELVFMLKRHLLAGDRWRLFAGEVVFQRCEEMSDDWDAPGPAQELLPGSTTHVGHVCVVDREAEDPAVSRNTS